MELCILCTIISCIYKGREGLSQSLLSIDSTQSTELATQSHPKDDGPAGNDC